MNAPSPALAALLPLLACAAARPAAPPPPAPPPQQQQPEAPAQAAASPAPAARAPEPSEPGIDPSLVDPAVRPCDDFYAFACNGWLARAEIPPDRARWTRSFDVINQEVEVRLRQLLEEAAAGRPPAGDRNGVLLGELYAGCMDEERIEKNGLSDLRAEWRALEGVRDLASLSAAVGRLHRRSVFPLFALSAGPDARDPGLTIGLLRQGGLSLPDRDYYLREGAEADALRSAFEAHVEAQLGRAGMPADQAAADARVVLEVETELARSHLTRTELRDPVRTYNPMDRAALRAALPRLDWDRYLAAAGAAQAAAFSATTPAMWPALDGLMGRLSPTAWRAYLRWHVLSDAAQARALPRALSEEDFRFRALHFTGQRALPERWRSCVILADELLGEALGEAFVRRHFGGEARARALALVGGIGAAMGRSLETRAWMDSPTRARALEKLAAMGNKIGYPEAWRSYRGLEVHRQDFYGAVRGARAFEERRILSRIGRPPDRREWRMSPPTVNAYYSPPMNEMVFPAGILQPPFYTAGANDAVNHGAIGVVVGHELTHGFDDQGRRYDARGALAEWWTGGVGEEYQRRAACLVRQFSGYVAVDDRHVDGALTLGENIADLGGMALSWEAYRAAREGRPPEAPVGGFTAEQQFFLGHAQAWCQLIRPENARLRAVTDPHSPARWRVNGPLSDFPPFAEAFGCSAGDPMVREERCEIW